MILCLFYFGMMMAIIEEISRISMKNSTLGAIMQKTFAKSVTGCGLILDQDNDYWWDEISSIPPGFISSEENSRIVIRDWKNRR